MGNEMYNDNSPNLLSNTGYNLKFCRISTRLCDLLQPRVRKNTFFGNVVLKKKRKNDQ